LKRANIPDIYFSVKTGASLAGGGALPTREIPSALIAIQSNCYSPSDLESRLRKLDMPIIARIAGDEVLFDLRTIDEQEFAFIRDGLKSIAIK
jgi:L-seryl-tRNA(Ser) seleniumtransferase